MSKNRGIFRTSLVALIPLVLSACGGDGGDDAATTGGAGAAAVEIQNPGAITGVVSFTGTPPALEPIDMREEPDCAAKHEGTPVQARVVASNGTLGNVFVYVKEGLSQSYPPTGDAPEIDQDGCIYHPRVIGVQTGQNLTILNSDPVLHNVNARPSANRGFNISQPQAGMSSERSFSTPEVMIPVQCDVHSWMRAYIGVVDHPYFAVTGEDGSFSLENLPPGDYVVEAWHEVYGAQTTNVTVPPDGTAEAGFSFDASTAASAVVPLGAAIDLHDHSVAHVQTKLGG